MTAKMQDFPVDFSSMKFRLSCDLVKDVGTVVVDGQGPLLRNPSITDKGNVRLGGQGPVFRV